MEKMGIGWLVTKNDDENRVLEHILKKHPFLKKGEPPIREYFNKEWRLFLERNRALY